jgi:hypothetical protein
MEFLIFTAVVNNPDFIRVFGVKTLCWCILERKKELGPVGKTNFLYFFKLRELLKN